VEGAWESSFVVAAPQLDSVEKNGSAPRTYPGRLNVINANWVTTLRKKGENYWAAPAKGGVWAHVVQCGQKNLQKRTPQRRPHRGGKGGNVRGDRTQ